MIRFVRGPAEQNAREPWRGLGAEITLQKENNLASGGAYRAEEGRTNGNKKRTEPEQRNGRKECVVRRDVGQSPQGRGVCFSKTSVDVMKDPVMVGWVELDCLKWDMTRDVAARILDLLHLL